MARKAARRTPPRPSPLRRSASPVRRHVRTSTRAGRARRKAAASAEAPWTVLVYMAAHLSPELDAHAVRDLREMERAPLAPGIRVAVQINRHWPRQPQRYEIEDGVAKLTSGNLNDRSTGDRASLERFMKWAVGRDRARDPQEKNRRYFLVLWGHAYGLGFGRDHGDALTLQDLAAALDHFKTLHPGGRSLDLLGANACAMAYAEAAFELKDKVPLLVASQIAVPFAGWPFETVLGAITAASTAEDIGRIVVDRYIASFRAAGTGEFVSMSLLNLAALDQPVAPRAGTFKVEFANMAAAMKAMVDGARPGASDRLCHLRAAMLSAGVGEVRPLVDLHDVCMRVQEVSQDLAELQPLAPGKQDLEESAGRLAAFCTPPTDDEVRRNGASDRFIVAYDHTGEARDLHGVGIYVPFVTDPRDLKRLGLGDDERPRPGAPAMNGRAANEEATGRHTYHDLALVKDTEWETVVYDALRAGLPGEVVDNVDRSGATSRAQRADVMQMLVAVDSLFDVLDRRIATVGACVSRAVPGAGAMPVIRQPAPFLELQLIDHEQVRTLAEKVKPKPSSPQAPPDARKAIDRFVDLEGTLGRLERAVTRTLTNGTYGLGPGPGGAAAFAPLSHGKGSGHGADEPKGSGHGADADKGSGHGPPPEDDKGSGHGPPMATLAASLALTALSATPAAVVAGLFAEVGASLRAIEAAAGRAETLLALAVTSGGRVVNGGAPNAMQIARTFRILADASTQARRTLRRVLAHPVYGFGPGPEGLTAEDRRELARAGGLSSMELRLL